MGKHLLFIVVTLISKLISASDGLCIFGDEADCYFPCHCAGASTGGCDKLTGRCNSGCEKGKPIIYGDWQSDGCMLGNVALNKPTFSNTVISKDSKNYNRPQLWYNTNQTVDGSMKVKVFDGSCTVVYTANKTTLPWLTLDLQDTFRIPKVVLVNTDNSIDSSYLETFYIKIGNSSNITEQAICVKYYQKVRSNGRKTILCDEPLVGRYVTIEKFSERNKVGRLPLCEIIVFGHKPMEIEWEKCYDKSEYNMFCKKCMGTIPPDCIKICPNNSYGQYCEGECGHCKSAEQCDKITGKCNSCEIGWQMPKCDQACPNNTYGYNCIHQCGNCNQNQRCNIKSGFCPTGCTQWYANEDVFCKTFISVKDLGTTLKSLFVKQTTVILSINDFFIESKIRKYYKFKLYHLHEHDPLKNAEEYKYIKIHFQNDTGVKIEIDRLIPNTQYWFQLQIFRQHNNISEGGKKSNTVKITTLKISDEELTNGSPPKISHHIGVATIVINLLIVIILIAVGIGAGVFFYRKYKRSRNSNDNKRRSSVDSQIEIINQSEENGYSHYNSD